MKQQNQKPEKIDWMGTPEEIDYFRSKCYEWAHQEKEIAKIEAFEILNNFFKRLKITEVKRQGRENSLKVQVSLSEVVNPKTGDNFYLISRNTDYKIYNNRGEESNRIELIVKEQDNKKIDEIYNKYLLNRNSGVFYNPAIVRLETIKRDYPKENSFKKAIIELPLRYITLYNNPVTYSYHGIEQMIWPDFEKTKEIISDINRRINSK